MTAADPARETVHAAFRARLVCATLFLCFALLGVRLAWIQLVHHDQYARASRGQHLQRVEDPALRGDLVDRCGRVLATSRVVPGIALDPMLLPEEGRDALLDAVAAAADVDAAALKNRVARSRRFAWVRRAVEDADVVARLRALDLPAGALLYRDEVRRLYPMGALGSQVLGVVGIDGHGLEGLERVRDAELRGTPGRRVVLVDAARKQIAVPDGERVPAVRGRDLRLTMDAVIQGFAEDELHRARTEHGAKAGACVVLDVATGDVLALASEPSPGAGGAAAATMEERRIRAVTDVFEPGSTFKPLIAAAALECGAIREGESIDCGEGWIRVGKRVIHEHESRGYGRISLEKVLAVSSNCGMARVGVRLGIPRTQAVLRAFGFGRTTGIGLPGEAPGMVTPPARWTETYTLVSVSFGQEIAVTPLQLAAAFLPVAGDGTAVAPRIVVEGDDLRPRTRVLSPATAARMREMLETVVTDGTAKSIRGSGYRIAGKTGTAQKMKGGQSAAYVSSFIGFAPADQPRVLCLVLLDEPSRAKGTPYGSRVAAPAVGEILRRSLRYLGVRPDETSGSRP